MGAQRRKKIRKLGFVGKIILLANIVLALLLLGSYLAPMTDPQGFWPVAFLGMAYLPLLCLNALFILIWLFRKRSYMLISVTAILLGWNALQAHIGFRGLFRGALRDTHMDMPRDTASSGQPAGQSAEQPVRPDTGSIRVLTYNVHLFRDFKQTKNKPDIQEEAISLMAGVDPDVVCLQEFYTRKKGKHDVSEALRSQLGLAHQYIHPVAQNDFESYGLAIFSKFPIKASGHLPDFEMGVNSIIYADIEKDGKVVRVYNVHLRSFGFKQEDYDFIAGPAEGTIEMNVSSTRRIGSRIKHAFVARSMQGRSLRKHSEACPVPYLIMGDFNDTPLSFAVNHVGKGLKNAFREKGSGWGKTYNGDFPNFQIDYIMASPGFEVAQYRIIKRRLSDHYPVWAELRFQ